MNKDFGQELEYLESLEPTEIPQDVITSFEEYVQLLEAQGEYQGMKKLLFTFGAYSVLSLLIFSQMGAGPGWKLDLSRLFSLLPLIFQVFLQGTLFSVVGWVIAQKRMNSIEKKIFQIQWFRQVSTIIFLTGISFWLFGDVPMAMLLPWVGGAYLGAHLVTKES